MPNSGIFLGKDGLFCLGQRGHTGLHVIAGCMKSGKSEELIRLLSLWKHTDSDIEIYCHEETVQREDDHIKSRTGTLFSAHFISTLHHIPLRTDLPRQRVIGIDEAHFFRPEETDVLAELARQALVIVAGLDTDFRGEPFAFMAFSLAMADTVAKLAAVCAACKQPNATFTQRLVNGEPAPYELSPFAPGDEGMYEPRCRLCHEVSPPKLQVH